MDNNGNFFSTHHRHRLASCLTINELREIFESVKESEARSIYTDGLQGLLVEGAVIPRIKEAMECWEARKKTDGTASGLELIQGRLVELDNLVREVEGYCRGASVAPIQAEVHDASVDTDQSGKIDDVDVRKQAYCECLDRTHETKKWNALAAYFHASVEGGEYSNARIAGLTKHKGKIADLIDRGENIANREGLPLLTMPPKREKQKGSRPPRHPGR